ncbi:MAG: Gfo/Idh/MocA family oxidoreductase [Bacteroidota bacterium]
MKSLYQNKINSDHPTYDVVVVGLGKRGMHHFQAYEEHPQTQVTGVCDLDASRLLQLRESKPDLFISSSAEAVIGTAQPDILCICTPPSVRLPLIKLAVENNVKLIAMEKPICYSSQEAFQIKSLLDSKGVKAVVSHQHLYAPAYQTVNRIIKSGEIGKVHTVYGTAAGWMMHMASHLVSYMSWFNHQEDISWVMGQASGKGKFKTDHKSPDYLAGFIQFDNGVRGILESGGGAPDVPEVDHWWRKNRIGAQGTHGYAEVLTGIGWRAMTKDGYQSGEGGMNYEHDMKYYIADTIEWLDGASPPLCNFDQAYKGHQAVMALCKSVVEGGQVSLPLQTLSHEIDDLFHYMSDKALLVSSDKHSKYYCESD